MTRRRGRDVPSSVRQRLLDFARARGEDFQLVLTRFASERLLYRLGRSRHADRFVLKGALLFALWTGRMLRPTRDVDLLGHGPPDAGDLVAIFREACGLDAGPDDGLRFHADSVAAGPIRADQEYEGVRVRLRVTLGRARIDLQVDVGFGDAVTPPAEYVEFPPLLDFPAPRIRAYPRETVVAEKYQAMVQLGVANSRMKDFFDVWVMAREFAFDGVSLSDAIRATFERRRTAVPGRPPLALTPGFGEDPAKGRQWQAFASRSGAAASLPSLADVVEDLARFLMPPSQAVAAGTEFPGRWEAGGPWSP
ncbi:MAG: nucleotidyl transferase AbiEii/AbiGii toxin family protein [Isosphaeraceae bacterium]